MRKLIAMLLSLAMVVTVVALTGMTSKVVAEEPSNASSYLVDYDSGRVLVESQADDKRPIASMVKIMTLLLTFESADRGELSYDEEVIISHAAAIQTGSEMFLDEGGSYPVVDVIKGVVTMSANDGSVVLAERLAGSESKFVELMNARAVELGMANTVYTNSTGLPTDAEQYSTARDVTTVMRELVGHSNYHLYSSVWLEDYTHPSGRVTQLANTNKLVRHYKGCDSGKTGYTDSAKFCLSASATRAGMRVVGTVIGAENSKVRFATMSQMFNMAFGAYKREVYLSSSSPLSIDVKVDGGKIDVLTPIIDRDLAMLVEKSEGKYEVRFDLPESVRAPIVKGQEIGTVSLVDGDKVLMTVKVLSDIDIAKASIWDYIKKIV